MTLQLTLSNIIPGKELYSISQSRTVLWFDYLKKNYFIFCSYCDLLIWSIKHNPYSMNINCHLNFNSSPEVLSLPWNKKFSHYLLLTQSNLLSNGNTAGRKYKPEYIPLGYATKSKEKLHMLFWCQVTD